jgi:hypothetical protein
MSDERSPKTDPGQATVYQIRLKGHLGPRWTEWFGGLTITLEDDGDTLITGPVVDQAALHGLLKKVRDLGMPLLSVNRVEPGPSASLPSCLGAGGTPPRPVRCRPGTGKPRERDLRRYTAGKADASDVKQ